MRPPIPNRIVVNSIARGKIVAKIRNCGPEEPVDHVTKSESAIDTNEHAATTAIAATYPRRIRYRSTPWRLSSPDPGPCN